MAELYFILSPVLKQTLDNGPDHYRLQDKALAVQWWSVGTKLNEVKKIVIYNSKQTEVMMQNHLEYTFLVGSERTVKVQVFVGTSEPPQQLMDDLDFKVQEVKDAWKKKVMEELEQEFQDESPL